MPCPSTSAAFFLPTSELTEVLNSHLPTSLISTISQSYHTSPYNLTMSTFVNPALTASNTHDEDYTMDDM